MRVEQSHWTRAGWTPAPPGGLGASAQLLLVFGGRFVLRDAEPMSTLRRLYPRAHVLGCSTAGEICGIHVSDDSLVATAVHFEHTEIQGAQTRVESVEDSFASGQRLAEALPHAGLVHVFVLAEGVGRRLVLKQRIEEEVEAVLDVLGPRTLLAGFYSYGELGPSTPSARCELHNQAMTITTFAEA